MIALIAVVGLSHRSKKIDSAGDVATTPFQLGNTLKLLLEAFSSFLKMALTLRQIEMHRAVLETSHFAYSLFEIAWPKKPDRSSSITAGFSQPRGADYRCMAWMPHRQRFNPR
jgi:hypothetical protein